MFFLAIKVFSFGIAFKTRSLEGSPKYDSLTSSSSKDGFKCSTILSNTFPVIPVFLKLSVDNLVHLLTNVFICGSMQNTKLLRSNLTISDVKLLDKWFIDSFDKLVSEKLASFKLTHLLVIRKSQNSSQQKNIKLCSSCSWV